MENAKIRSRTGPGTAPNGASGSFTSSENIGRRDQTVNGFPERFYAASVWEGLGRCALRLPLCHAIPPTTGCQPRVRGPIHPFRTPLVHPVQFWPLCKFSACPVLPSFQSPLSPVQLYFWWFGQLAADSSPFAGPCGRFLGLIVPRVAKLLSPRPLHWTVTPSECTCGRDQTANRSPDGLFFCRVWLGLVFPACLLLAPLSGPTRGGNPTPFHSAWMMHGPCYAGPHPPHRPQRKLTSTWGSGTIPWPASQVAPASRRPSYPTHLHLPLATYMPTGGSCVHTPPPPSMYLPLDT